MNSNLFQEPGSDARDASRIAAQMAMAKEAQRAPTHYISKSKSRGKRKFKKDIGFGKPRIQVDTSVSRHRAPTPRELHQRQGSSTTRDDRTRSVSWRQKARSIREQKRQAESTENEDMIVLLRSLDAGNGLALDISPQPRPTSPSSTTSPRSRNFTESPYTLQPEPFSATDISPSDRPIMIGISVPSDRLPELASPLSSTTARREVMPEIIVTPAVTNSGWCNPNSQSSNSGSYNPRPASSIYSQATSWSPSLYCPENAPPVPVVPYHILCQDRIRTQGHPVTETIWNTGVSAPATAVVENYKVQGKRDSSMTDFEEDDEMLRRERITSGMTIFEEDQTPIGVQAHQGRPKNDLQVVTDIPISRLSTGWWNVITTPFEFSRSNSGRWTRNTSEEPPEMPILSARSMFSASTLDTPVATSKTITSPTSPLRSATAASPGSIEWETDEKDIELESPNLIMRYLNAVETDATWKPATPQWVDLEGHRDNVILSSQSTIPQPVINTLEHSTNQSKSNIHITLNTTKYETIIRNNSAAVPPTSVVAVPPTITSPVSSISESSPVIEIASLGTILAPRAFHQGTGLSKPQPVATQTSEMRNSPSAYKAQPPPHITLNFQDSSTVFPPPPKVARTDSPSGNRQSPVPNYAGTKFTRVQGYEIEPQQKTKTKKKQIISFDCIRKRKDDHRQEKEKKKKKKRCCGCGCFICLGIIMACIIILIVTLAVTLTRKSNGQSTQQSPVQFPGSTPNPTMSWATVSGYPPVPTGQLTVTQPDKGVAQSGCVFPGTLWSCSVPKEQHAVIAPSKPDQPNFRLEIQVSNKNTANIHSRSIGGSRTPMAILSRHLLNPRQTTPTTNSSPSPPSLNDQKFLGKTTDLNRGTVEGEETPFHISFFGPSSTITQLSKRQSPDSNNHTINFENATAVIPPPASLGDGTAAPAELLPSLIAQPLRLYDRGLPTEHYGFYNYFDRSIFLKSINDTGSAFGATPADLDGGATLESATQRCTWAQTRFKMQIFTKPDGKKQLLPPPTSTIGRGDMVRPGSFPYPITISLDRHGGERAKKMIYCYAINKNGKIQGDQASFVQEDRSFGGKLVNPSQGPFVFVPIDPKEGGPGGMDGGTGGCGCDWSNWLT